MKALPKKQSIRVALTFVVLLKLAGMPLILGGCPTFCTSLGCDDHLYLIMAIEDGLDDAPRNVEQEVSGSVIMGLETIDFECPHPDPHNWDPSYACQDSRVAIRGLTEDITEVELDIQTNDAPPYVFSGAIDIDPELVYPNGIDCPPGCVQATATIVLEASQ